MGAIRVVLEPIVDAHQDAAPYGVGHPAHYGTFIKSIIDDNLVDGKHLIQAGMRRPVNALDALEWQRRVGVTTYYMADIRNRGFKPVGGDARECYV